MWSVDDAVQAAVSNPEVEGVLEAQLHSVNAEMAEATVLPTPSLGLSHQQVLGASEVAGIEFSVMIEQELNLLDWRERLREAVPHRESALRAQIAEWRLDVATDVHIAFFQVRYHQERVKVLDAWIVRLQTGVANFSAREDGGDISPYEVRRVERELETAQAQRAREDSLLAESWAALRMWAPWESQPELEGPLAPEPTEADAEVTLPRLAMLEHRQRSLDAEAAAWGDPFWRGWVVAAGYRLAHAGAETGHGFLASVQIPLPLWDTQRPRIERIEAERASVGSELSLARSMADQAEQAAQMRVLKTIEALQKLSPPERDADLTRMAEVAYKADEATLTELLDAYESEADLQLSRADLEWEARRASIELEGRRGSLGAVNDAL